MNGDDDNLIRAAPGLARIAVGAYWRTAQFAAEQGVRMSSRVLRAAVSGETAAEMLNDLGDEARRTARRLLGVIDEEAHAARNGDDEPVPPPAGTTDALRERGSELLSRSADVAYEEDAHPAYARILDELAPDEARILRFLRANGAQPAVDVRTAKLPLISSELVAPGISMIGAGAGVRYLDRVPAYLNNLYRLGLIWFSREPLENPLDYQVLEAQPDVLDAKRGAGRGAKTVRRQILLTPFGLDFCRVCLP
jgi:Abortive infection alpha